MLGDFASLDVQNTYRGSDAYDNHERPHQALGDFVPAEYFQGQK
ncbi:hypothetical protein ACGP04_10160 [Piscirickettsia salmonis]